jgi:hypothetical protein
MRVVENVVVSAGADDAIRGYLAHVEQGCLNGQESEKELREARSYAVEIVWELAMKNPDLIPIQRVLNEHYEHIRREVKLNNGY